MKMNNIILLVTILLTITSCNTSSKKAKEENDIENSKTEQNESSINSEQIKKMTGKVFFDYDEIEYYFCNYEESKIGDLYDNQSKSELDSLKMGVILGHIPKSITDLNFINSLSKIGYKGKSVEKSKFAEINQIFKEKEVKENIATACIYVYRDILIFKKQNKIVGTAKICFGCMANEIQGTTANTDNFGQDGDYDKLENILRK